MFGFFTFLKNLFRLLILGKHLLHVESCNDMKLISWNKRLVFISNIWGWNFCFLGPEANLPTEAAEQVATKVEVNNSLLEHLQEAVQDGPEPQEVKVVNVQKAENQSKKK